MVVLDSLLYDGFLHFMCCGVRFGRKADCNWYGDMFCYMVFCMGKGEGEGGDRVCMDVTGG
jgi:hypothetical protein